MENASKALLIAGSVLIAILLIAVGMKVFNSTTGTTDATKSTMETATITMINNQFTQYVGNNKSTSQISAVVNKIVVYNSSKDSESEKIVLLMSEDKNSYYSGYRINTRNTDKMIMMLGHIMDKNYTWSVDVKFGSNGIVSEIWIKPN